MKRRAYKGVKIVEQVENVVHSMVMSFEDTRKSKSNWKT